MNTRIGYAGMSNAFEITLDGGAYCTGYLYDADFPGLPESKSRGEVFFVSVPMSARMRGNGRSLVTHALTLMKARGVTEVNFNPVTDGGKFLLASLERQGIIQEIERVETGKRRYHIVL